MKPCGNLRNPMEPYGNLRNPNEPYGTLWGPRSQQLPAPLASLPPASFQGQMANNEDNEPLDSLKIDTLRDKLWANCVCVCVWLGRDPKQRESNQANTKNMFVHIAG